MLLPFVVMSLSDVMGSVPKPMANVWAGPGGAACTDLCPVGVPYVRPSETFPLENAILETNTGCLPLAYAAGRVTRSP